MAGPVKCSNCGAPLDVKGRESDIVRCDYCGTDTMLETKARTVVAEDSRQFAVKLMKAIVDNLDLDEIRDLVVRLNAALPEPYSLEYENLSGSSDIAKARELVLWCQRRRLLQLLVDTLLSVRPSLDLSS
jgi:DNA-directed RNA polymerase subunit RPC12/RpoP